MSVLGTKLHLPTPRRELVPRPRLTAQLLASPQSMPRLVLVAAPAGFGKTTMLTQWLTATGEDRAAPTHRVAWLSLDDGDSDLPRFLTHVVAALRTTNPDVGVDALALLENDRGFEADDVLVSLVNDLDTAAGPTVLALDDYHVIDAAAVHEAVTFLLDNLPGRRSPSPSRPGPTRRCRCPGCGPGGSSSRSGPPTCGSRPTRPSAFLNEVMGLDLEPTYVEALEARTEGWAAGLQLAGCRPEPAPTADVGGFVEAFTRQPPVRPRLPARGGPARASPTTSGRSSSTPRCSAS